MSSDYELSDNDVEYSDEEMIDGTQDDQGELTLLVVFPSQVFICCD